MLTDSERLASGARTLIWGVAAGVGLLLALRSIHLAYDLSRPIPYWDQWEFFKRAPDVLAGRFGFADLIAQHNEHRIATSRAVFILDLLYFEGTSTLCIAVFYATLALVAALIAGRFPSPLSRTAAFFVFLGFLLSPAQWENLTSGFQIQFPFVDLFALGSLACLIAAIDRPRDSRSAWGLAAAASALDLLAVFSMASGLLAVVPAIWAGIAFRTRSRPFFAFLAGHGLYSALFLIGYSRGGGVAMAVDPVLVARFVVVYMGACLRGYPHGPFLLGSADLACLAGAVCWTLWQGSRGRARVDRVQVFATGAASLMVANAALTAMGRASLGIEMAVSSRYSLQSIVLQIALFTALWSIVRGRAVLRIPPSFARAALLAGITAVSLASNLSPASRAEWEDHVADLDKAGFALVNGVPSDDRLKLVYPVPDLVHGTAAYLATHGLGPFSPRFGRAYRMPRNAPSGLDIDAADDCAAGVGIHRKGPHWFDVEGWAYDPKRPTGNGWVFILDRSDHDRVVGFGRQSLSRPDVDEAMDVAVGRSGLDVSVDAAGSGGGPPRALTLVVVPEGAGQPSCKAAVPAQESE